MEGVKFTVVSEFIPSDSLKHLLLNQPLSDKLKLHILLEIAHLLQALHAKQIYHKALKPKNIRVVNKDPQPNGIKTKLCNFDFYDNSAYNAMPGLTEITEISNGLRNSIWFISYLRDFWSFQYCFWKFQYLWSTIYYLRDLRRSLNIFSNNSSFSLN